MVFSSLLFVFLFLALNLVSQAALRGARPQNIAMLLFSLVFFSAWRWCCWCWASLSTRAS